MSDDLLQELIDADTPTALVLKVAQSLARLEGERDALERNTPAQIDTRSPAAIRQARYRHNKASQNVTDHNDVTFVTESITSVPPSPPP